jgi:hypothetical protein
MSRKRARSFEVRLGAGSGLDVLEVTHLECVSCRIESTVNCFRGQCIV